MGCDVAAQEKLGVGFSVVPPRLGTFFSNAGSSPLTIRLHNNVAFGPNIGAGLIPKGWMFLHAAPVPSAKHKGPRESRYSLAYGGLGWIYSSRVLQTRNRPPGSSSFASA